MAIFAANRSLQIFSCSLLISSLAKKGYKTSGPVRYIPRNYTLIKKLQKSPPLESYEKKEGLLSKNGGLEGGRSAHELPNFDYVCQSSIFDAEIIKSSDNFEHVEDILEIEDATSSALGLIETDVGSESELLLDEVSYSHENSIAERNELLGSKVRQDAENIAIELLAARAFTEVELKKKLRAKKYPPNVVESVVADIKCRGLLNDGLYAESFSRSRWLSSTWGPRRIKQALIQKGVSEVEADKATKQVFEGDDLDSDGQNMQHGMSKLSMDRLFLQASKQWLRGQNISLENRKSRIVRWLQYRGFNWGVTNFILKKLESQYPP